MILFLLLLIIAIMLFGANSVKSGIIKVVTYIFGFAVLTFLLVVADDLIRNINWYIFIPSILILIIISRFMKKKKIKQNRAEPNATFSLLMNGRLPNVKVSQKDKYVMLNPIEVFNLLFDWDSAQAKQGQTFTTVFSTTFKIIPVNQIVLNNSVLIKSLREKGIDFYVQISQYDQHQYQTNQTLNLNPQAILSLGQWMNDLKSKNEVIKALYESHNK